MQMPHARRDRLPKRTQQSELPRHATGPFRHADRKRKPGDYCNAKCVLCYVAAVFTLSARGAESKVILDLKPGEALGVAGKKSLRLVALIEATQADVDSLKR